MTDFNLQVEEFTERATLDNFRELNDKFKENQFLRFEGVHISQSYTEATTNVKIAHGLNGIPKDILVTKEDPASTLTINWDEIDSDYIDITVSAACDVRMFVGSYVEVGK